MPLLSVVVTFIRDAGSYKYLLLVAEVCVVCAVWCGRVEAGNSLKVELDISIIEWWW
jgi:hypothetical protein